MSEQQLHDRFHMMANHIRIIAEEMLEEFYGERCDTFEPNCDCCKRWKALDALIKNPFDEVDT